MSAPERRHDPACDLCREERITEWFHEDPTCWVAACSVCATPMVVWRNHDNAPPPDVKAALHASLAEVWARLHPGEHWVDDDMRRIPDHYHAHARPAGGFFGHALPRLDLP